MFYYGWFKFIVLHPPSRRCRFTAVNGGYINPIRTPRSTNGGWNTPPYIKLKSYAIFVNSAGAILFRANRDLSQIYSPKI